MSTPPDSSGTSADPGPAVLLLRAHPGRVAAWARRGVLAVDVVPQPRGWTAVVAIGTDSALHRPYDDAVSVLLAQRVPLRLRPAIGVCRAGQRILVAVVPRRVRAERRWLAWEPGRGLVAPGGLPEARVDELAAAADLPGRADLEAVRDLLHRADADPHRVAAQLFATLRLPGADLLDAPDSGLRLDPEVREVTPKPRHQRAFDRTVGEDRSWHDEINGPR